MYHNDTLCDIYIGSGAGKKLLEEIQGAQSTVDVVSPYLSSFFVNKLYLLSKRGVQIRLITSDDSAYRKEKIDKKPVMEKFTIQTTYSVKDARNKEKRWLKFKKYCTIGIPVGFAIMGIFYYFTEDIRSLCLLILPAVLFFKLIVYVRKLKNLAVYRHVYNGVFPFKIYSSKYPYKLIHSKIFVIDNRVAYLGSVNFTKSGLEDHHEARIRVKDPVAISKITEEIEELFYNKKQKYKELDFHSWVTDYFPEPINARDKKPMKGNRMKKKRFKYSGNNRPFKYFKN